jgi:predicted ATPase/class 3 adenylate cyclase
MPNLPTGTVTFLFTDVEGSTRLWEQVPAAMRAATRRHDALVDEIVSGSGGVLIRPRGEGDSRFAVFVRATDAVAAAAALQVALTAEPWSTPSPVRVRMALHTGEADLRDGDYYGSAVNRCARLRAIAHGGQTLLSQTTHDLVRQGLPDGVSLRDLGEQRLADLTLPERVFQVTHPDLPANFPSLKSLDAFPHNLPLQLTSFIGREHEIAEVIRFVASARLVTLTGAGGCGKTRLALQVASELLSGYPGGAWFIDLAPLSDPALVPQAVAAAVGVREQPGHALLETLLDYLRGRTLLLVLDNCEHLVDAAAHLTDTLLARCPDVRLLATSRELLGATGERTLRVPSLTLPAPDQPSSVEGVARCEGVQLFVERARAFAPGFAVTQQNAAALAQICRRLDGIPLAIELAAARVRVLTAEQIAARLDDRFRLLTGGGRTARRRQQTLQATVDWSHDLLPDPERALFRRLAVFAGGWSLEAAERVCVFAGIESSDVLDLLTSLADKSLVAAEAGGASARYRLLETLRQYAEDKLFQSGEAAIARDSHRDWCRELARAAEPELHGPHAGAWLDRLDAEKDNLRAALAWCREAPDATGIGLEIAGNLGWFWDFHDYFQEGMDWIETFLAIAPAPTRSRARALLALEQDLRFAWKSGEARAAAEEARWIFEEIGDASGAAEAIGRCGVLAANDGDYAVGHALLEESLAAVRALGDRRATLDRLRDLALVSIATGEFGRARAQLRESLAIARELKVPQRVGIGLLRLAIVDRLEGDLARSRTHAEESLTLLVEGRHAGGVEWARIVLADLARAEERFGEARATFVEGLALHHERGDQVSTAEYVCWLGLVAIDQGNLARGVRLLGAGAVVNRLFGTIHEPDLRLGARTGLAGARAVLGEGPFAAAWAEGQAMTLEQAVAYALEDGDA